MSFWTSRWAAVVLAAGVTVAGFHGCVNAAETSLQKVGDEATPSLAMPGRDRTDAEPVSRFTRLVTFRYNPEVAYAIRSLEGVFTNIEVPEGESVAGFYLSDDTNWSFHVTADKRRVLVKPAVAGEVNTGTLVTEKRTYELTFTSVARGELWHQRVRWAVPGEDGADIGVYVDAGKGRDGDPTVDPARLNFRYEVQVKVGAIRPSAVFDDGERTWIAFDEREQDLPAIFATDRRQRSLDVVEFSRQGRYVVVPHIAEAFVLRLGRSETVILRR